MDISNFSPKELVEELKRRGFKSIFVNPGDTYKIDIVPQPGSIGDFIEDKGAVTILVIED